VLTNPPLTSSISVKTNTRLVTDSDINIHTVSDRQWHKHALSFLFRQAAASLTLNIKNRGEESHFTCCSIHFLFLFLPSKKNRRLFKKFKKMSFFVGDCSSSRSVYRGDYSLIERDERNRLRTTALERKQLRDKETAKRRKIQVWFSLLVVEFRFIFLFILYL